MAGPLAMSATALVLALCLWACQGAHQVAAASSERAPTKEPRQQAHKVAGSSLAEPLLTFGAALFGAEASGRKKENLLVSPISLHQALGMLLLGAKKISSTEVFLNRVLGYKTHYLAQLGHEEYQKLLESYKNANVPAKWEEEGEPADKCKFVCEQRRLQSAKLEPKPTAKVAATAARDHHNDDEDDGDGDDSDSDYDPDDDKCDCAQYKPPQKALPESPLIDIFNMLIVKDNSSSVRDAYRKKLSQFYDASLEQLDDSRPETRGSLLERLSNWSKEAGFAQSIMSDQELAEQFQLMLLSGIQLRARWFQDCEERQAKAMFWNLGSPLKPLNGTVLHCADRHKLRFVDFAQPAEWRVGQPMSRIRQEQQRQRQHHRRRQSGATNNVNEGTREFETQFKFDPDDTELDWVTSLSWFNFRALQVPLKGGLTFTIFEPFERSEEALPNLVARLTSFKALDKALRVLDGPWGDPTGAYRGLTFPKFTFENNLDMQTSLRKMGLESIFEKAELTLMMDDKPMKVGKCLHQTMIEMTRGGIKAAGFTKISTARTTSTGFKKVTRPFMFVVRQKKLPLFIGQLAQL